MASIQDYKDRLRFIQLYVRDFDAKHGYDMRKAGSWSSARKAAITRYFNLITALKARSTHIYRPRKKSNMENYRRKIGAESYRKLKVGFIQAPTELTIEGERVPVKTRVRFKKDGTMQVSYNNISRETISFDQYEITPEQLALYPVETIKEIIETLDYPRYSITAGEFEVGRGVTTFYSKKQLAAKVKELTEKYSADKYDEDDTSSSYFGNWLHGITGYKINIKQIMSYHEAQRIHHDKKALVNRKIKNAKTYIEKMERIIKAVENPRRLNAKERRYDYIESILKRRRKWTDKQKQARVKKKLQQIEEQNRRIHRLIVSRTKID